jgi:hypothetical protein
MTRRSFGTQLDNFSRRSSVSARTEAIHRAHRDADTGHVAGRAALIVD